MQLMAMRPPHSSSGASQVTVVPPQLLPMTVMGEQLSPTSTRMPLRSRPRIAATREAAPLLAGTTLEQHWLEVGGVTGGGGVPFGMAAARVMRTEATTTESLENIFA